MIQDIIPIVAIVSIFIGLPAIVFGFVFSLKWLQYKRDELEVRKSELELERQKLEALLTDTQQTTAIEK